MSPKVTIILPSLNVSDYIEVCIQSAISQSLHEIEIIIIDAGSTDGTWEIERAYAEKDNRIILLKSEKRSYGYQCNKAIDIAQGEYVAILETDDYVVPQMYERLYRVAKENNCDYVKADYDAYFTQKDGARFFLHRKTFATDDYYEKTITPRMIPEVAFSDWYLWQGVYKREFLDIFEIRFNETPGAAFQDIGFLCQTIARAERTMYLKDSLYRYCIDRTESSSNLGNALQYAQQEYECAEVHFRGDIDQNVRRSLYLRMTRSLVSAYMSGASFCNQTGDSHYRWFKERLTSAITEGMLDNNQLPADYKKKLGLLLESENAYFNAYPDQIQWLQKRLADNTSAQIVVFGCGNNGLRIYLRLKTMGRSISAYMDNNSALWGTILNGIPILQPTKRNIGCNQVFLIANEAYSEEIRKQLEDMGVSPDSIG